ncbi:hypothetical protein DAEQUDRAFT_686910 [Daedalea quercina L-15889]|uniref:Uncharacterized protein n=1 Tax=Daedalea quercina L-15889 TaxID=1314783 RepID=A0A165SHP7_9APHY|nr:hypothetical protein DAEQUDRAFT_686910 [Daedalea quercina L-15889]
MLLSTAGTTRPPLRHRGSESSAAHQEMYSDSRTHGYQGPTRHVRLSRVTAGGGAAIAKSEDGIRCVVAGRESLRILRVSPPDAIEPGSTTEHKSAAGQGGYQIDASRNLWDGSGLHMDSANTDVAWGHGVYSNKILTSARNGELIMWDLNKSGSTKYECRTRDHSRSIHALSYSSLLEKYCVTGSADGDLRVWDLRDMTKSIMWIRHPGPVRAVVFSPISTHPLQAISALDNGGIYRWDLSMGQRGQLDRILAAHSGPILTLDWTVSSGSVTPSRSPQSNWYGASSTALGLLDEIIPGSGGLQGVGIGSGNGDIDVAGMGWLASGGLDRCVKVWDLTAPLPTSHISHDPVYTLRTTFPVRRVLWRPGYECELAVVAHTDQGVNTSMELHTSTGGHLSPPGMALSAGLISAVSSPRLGNTSISIAEPMLEPAPSSPLNDGGAPIEIWDVRRGFIAKWVVHDSVGEGGVRDIAFADSHAIWAQHSSGAFSQLDLRFCNKPLDAVSRLAVTWDPMGTLAFAMDQRKRWEVPYDDVKPENRQLLREWHNISKALGDPPFMPTAQTVGTIAFGDVHNLETFVQLAQKYIYEGSDRQAICAHNAKVSLDAGNLEAAQTWFMLQSLLNGLIPELPIIPLSLPQIAPDLPPCVSAPAAIPPLQVSRPTSVEQRSMSIDRSTVGGSENRSLSPLSRDHIDGPSALGQRSSRPETPISSTASSPRKSSTSLPYLQTTLFSRRESNSGLSQSMRPRLASSFRRPSSSFLSSPSVRSMHSESPSESIRGYPSLKHVGEGALDDSDSSNSEDESSLVVHSRSDSGDEEVSLPYSAYPPRPGIAIHPSPLARQQSWTEDEGDNDDYESPSPGSSSDSDEPSHNPRSRPPRARTSARSRSSTVASLAVHAPSPKLVRQVSSASVRTVVAGHTTGQDDGDSQGQAIAHDLRKSEGSTKTSPNHNRNRSTTFADEAKIGLKHVKAALAENGVSSIGRTECSERVREAEARYRDLGWSALRDVLDDLADQGDVQMCALLSLVAPTELRIGAARALRFVEAYINILMKLRLYAAAAYLRKFVQIEEICSTTALQTTIYTCCTRCRKPLLTPAIRLQQSGPPSGSYAYCTACKSAISRCSICHLPVRAVAFTCSVCMHGGHQECYRRYYLVRPMVTMDPEPSAQNTTAPPSPPSNAPPFLGTRGRSSSRNGSGLHDSPSEDGSRPRDDREGDGVQQFRALACSLQGHVCAAGCGHFCWAAQKHP